MCFLEILTRTGRRPQALKRNMDSLKSLTDRDFSQTLLIDSVGRGVAWANENLGDYAVKLTGEFIWILDDDDICIYPQLVENLKNIVTVENPDVVMCKVIYHTYGELPPYHRWEQEPEFGQISMSNFFTKREVFQQYAYAFPQALGGDYSFISTVYEQPNIKVYWWDQIVMKIMQVGRGEPEHYDQHYQRSMAKT